MKLIIPASIERKLNAYVQEVDGEVAGMGEIERREDGNLWVVDIAIYDQEVTAGTADLSSEALAHFQTDLVKNGKSPKNWYLWWHSHDRFSAFFSATDTGTMESSTEFDHLVSLVVNKKRERKCRLDMHRPFRIFLENVKIEVLSEPSAKTIEIRSRISELTKELAAIEEEVPGGIEEVKADIASKVRFKQSKHKMGFKSEEDYLSLPYKEDWSGKVKKEGVITPQYVRRERLDLDELQVLIDESTRLIRAHEANGNGDSVECIELRADVSQWYSMLIDLNAGAYDDGDVYWNGSSFVSHSDDLPAVVSPYHGNRHEG